jgi:hypothetical protein
MGVAGFDVTARDGEPTFGFLARLDEHVIAFGKHDRVGRQCSSQRLEATQNSEVVGRSRKGQSEALGYFYPGVLDLRQKEQSAIEYFG